MPTRTVKYHKDEGGKRHHLQVNFKTGKKIKIKIFYTNDESSLEKQLSYQSKKKFNFEIYNITNLKTKYKNPIIINNNIIEFLPKTYSEYQLSFHIFKASRHMDNALFYLKITDTNDNILDTSANNILTKSKRKIPALLRQYPNNYFETIINNKKTKFTSNIHLSCFNKPKKTPRKRKRIQTLSQSPKQKKNNWIHLREYQKLETELKETRQELDKYKKRHEYEYDIRYMLSLNLP